MDVKPLRFPPAPPYPNNSRFPLLLYPNVVRDNICRPEWFEEQFEQNGWTYQWRNGVYAYHHYHSGAHEVLACYSGKASILFGGPEGMEQHFGRGDIVVVPAGVGHCLITSSRDFRVVGAYPIGTRPDTIEGDPDIYDAALLRSSKVPVPELDPLEGAQGPLKVLWEKRPLQTEANLDDSGKGAIFTN